MRILWLVLKIAVVVVVAGFLVRAFASNWETVVAGLHFESPWFLGGSWIAWMGLVLFQVLVWASILAALWSRLDGRLVARAHFLSQVAKYVPGRIWNLVGKVVMVRAAGLPTAQATASVILEAVYWNATGLWVGGLYFVLASPTAQVWLKWCGWAALVMTPLAFLPAVQRLAMRLVQKVWPALPAAKLLLPGQKSVLLIASCLVGWFINGLFTWLFLASMLPIETTFILPLTGILGVASVTSTLTVVAPGGLGIKEGALTLLLAPYLGFSTAAFVGIAYRLWLILCEVSLLPFAYMLGRRLEKREVVL